MSATSASLTSPLLFSLSLRGLSPPQGPPRPPASRLLNPQNSSPRQQQRQHAPHHQHHQPLHHPHHVLHDHSHHVLHDHPHHVQHTPPPNVLLQRPRSDRDEYPLLSLQQQRSTADDLAASTRTSIGLPPDQARARSSLHLDHHSHSPHRTHASPPSTPGPSSMALAADPHHADAHAHANDPEAAVRRPHSQPGRASLPDTARSSLSRSHSQRTNGDGDDASEFPWGPAHPCFPHPNPHVPLDTELYHSTRIIRIKRDWMVKGDLAPTFANLYPEILDPLVSEDDFRDLVQYINDALLAAFDPFTFRAWLDAAMGVATLWLWDDVGMSGVKKQLDALEAWIERWNRDVGEKEAVKIIPLRRTGYLTLDIQIPDPHLGPDNGTVSRPDTTEDKFGNQTRQKNEDYGHYILPPTLQLGSMTPPIEAQS